MSLCRPVTTARVARRRSGAASRPQLADWAMAVGAGAAISNGAQAGQAVTDGGGVVRTEAGAWYGAA